ncbi:MAG TPA: hypothetical protein PKG95_06835 [Anaerolineaceae bacterium]|jgi:hypothetical protein|nr:hypothetical protein [Anaerolineaceae bacterium]
MSNPSVIRDERTEVVENASYRLAYQIMSFGALIIVTYRGFLFQQSSWDLLALVVLSGAAATIYQGSQKILTRRWTRAILLILVVSAILAAILVWLIR